MQNTQHIASRRSVLPSWRRISRFRLRTLLLLIVVAQFPLAFWVVPAHRQAKAVRAVLASGGHLEYSTKSCLPFQPPVMAIRESTIDYLFPIKEVLLTGELSDEVWKSLRDLKSLQELNVTWPKGLSTRHLQHIGGLRDLRALILREFTDSDSRAADFEHLEKLTSLKELRLYRLPKAGRDLRFLSHYPHLEFLTLWDSQVSDMEEMDAICNCQQLQILELGGNPITDSAAKQLSTLRNLRTLELGGTEITSDTLVVLVSLPNLTSLGIDRTKIDDDAIDHLIEMPNLDFLDVRDTDISLEGYGRLCDSLPHCKVLSEHAAGRQP